MHHDEDDLDEVLELLGYQMTPDLREHLDVLLRALSIYDERSMSYGQIWKQYGAMNNLVRAATKWDRLMALWWHGKNRVMQAIHKDRLDDAFDGINYATFFIRCAEEGNLTGSEPERPGLRLVTE